MKDFQYAAPHSEDAAVALLAELPGKTEVLAGGTDLVGLLRKQVVAPERVVNIMQIGSLQEFGPTDDGGLRIGAAVTLDLLLASPYLDPYPAVRQAIEGINSMQLRCQGTLGGELCQRPRCWFFRNGQGLFGDHAEQGDNRFHAILGNSGPAKYVSASRIAPALMVLGARARVAAHGREASWIDVADFFRVPRQEGQRETVLEPGQLLTHIELPPAEGLLSATYEVRHGCGPEYPLAAAAAAFRHSGGVVREARLVLGHVAPVPWAARDAAQALVGGWIDEHSAERAGAAAVADATPLSNNLYKVQLAQVAAKRAILRAAGLETGGF